MLLKIKWFSLELKLLLLLLLKLLLFLGPLDIVNILQVEGTFFVDI
jgi:hypothetical protein